jgi:hypothetical protein
MLQDFYNWAETTWLGRLMQQHTLLFPVTEVIHIMCFTLLLGAVYTVNFRVLGFALKSRSLKEVMDGIAPLAMWGYISTFVTGFLLFIAESVKLSFNAAWHPKLGLLASALVVQFVLSRVLLKGGQEASPGAPAKAAAVASTLLWLGTGFAARWIAFI